ncbi:MAG: hypothetical protein Q7J85_06580 [Bacillota bacterium]|nr:hypothetical protein [Bacillota bacterium]
MPILILYIVWLLIFAAAHFALSVVVYRDAKKLPEPALGINPTLWLGIALSIPVIGMFIYWVMNYSTMKPNNE